jgi:hypothetical protein
MADLPPGVPESIANDVLAGLLRIHARKVEGQDPDTCFREAFDVCANFMNVIGEKLTDEILADIMGWVFHWAVIKKWIPWPPIRDLGPRVMLLGDPIPPRFAEIPESERTARLGEYSVTNEIRNSLINVLEGRIAYWQAEGLAPLARDRMPTRSPDTRSSPAFIEARGDSEPPNFASLLLRSTVEAHIRAQAEIEYERKLRELREKEESSRHAVSVAQSEHAVPAESPSELDPKGDPVAAERCSTLIAFKVKGRKQGILITDEMVARVANPGKWNTRTPVTWWKRNDSRIAPKQDRLIRAVLAKDPKSLWSPK